MISGENIRGATLKSGIQRIFHQTITSRSLMISRERHAIITDEIIFNCGTRAVFEGNKAIKMPDCVSSLCLLMDNFLPAAVLKGD